MVGFSIDVMPVSESSTAPTLGRPAAIDPRGPRFNQAVLAVGLLVAFVANWWPAVPIFATVLALGAIGGSKWAPFIRVYQQWVRPRLGPPTELEDPRPPRFAASVGAVFLVAATLAFLAGASGLGWALALVVVVLAGLAALTGICVGCEVYVRLARMRGAW